MTIDNLPNTLAGLLEVAIKDLKKVEQNSKYRVDMGFWHEIIGGQCVVCLAGAALAESCRVGPNQEIDFKLTGTKSLDSKLKAINSLRIGAVTEAYEEFYNKYDSHLHDFDVAVYEDREQFYNDLGEVLEYLKVKNL